MKAEAVVVAHSPSFHPADTADLLLTPSPTNEVELFATSEDSIISVGDWSGVENVVVKTKLLVKKFNGVRMTLQAVAPAGVEPNPKNKVTLKTIRNGNALFLNDFREPLKIEVVWSDDAPHTLEEALQAMTLANRQEAKTQFVQISAKPETPLAALTVGDETTAAHGGSRGQWQLHVENMGMLARQREHAKLSDWSLDLCMTPSPDALESAEALQQEEGAPGFGAVAEPAAPGLFGGLRERIANRPRLFAPREGGLFRASQAAPGAGAGLPLPAAGAGGILGRRPRLFGAAAGSRTPLQYALGYMTGLTYLGLGTAVATAVSTGTPISSVLTYPFLGAGGLYGGFAMAANATNGTAEANLTEPLNITLVEP